MAETEDKDKKGEIDAKIDTLLLDKRWIFFSSPFDDQSTRAAIRQLWYLEFTNPGKPILLVINSPGGSVDAGMALIDQIHMVSSPITTLVTGLAASMGSVLSLAAAPKHRFATPNARIMIHQPAIHGVIQGQATDLEIQAKEVIKTRTRLIEMYVKATGKDYDTISAALDRDTWMSAPEAKDYGLLDGVVTSYKEIGF